LLCPFDVFIRKGTTKMAATNQAVKATASTNVVLLMLASGQFLMTLDSSVMNVSIATVAADLGTTVSGIQTAITLYTLVMAALMITGGKIGAIIGHRRAFAIGCVIYGAGSLTTALAPNLTVLIIGWSGLEGIGAALIMPAIVALVAANFPPERRPTAYGLIAAAGAMAVAAGPLIGGFFTTYFSWRWVFAGEVLIVLVILAVSRRLQDPPQEKRPKLDIVGALLSIIGMTLTVFGVLKSGEWGWIVAKPGAPDILGTSPVIWLVLGGLLVLYGLTQWAERLEEQGREPLIRPSMLANRQLDGGLTMFFFQFLVQNSAFFVVPLFLSVVLELTAIDTGIRLLPLSFALLIAAALIPRLFPKTSPRRIVRFGIIGMFAGAACFMAGLDPGAGAEIVTVPMLLLGAGIGALASQLGAVTVSAVPDEESAEVGGLQNTMTNFGASLGTALVGSVLIASLTGAMMTTILSNPDIPQDVQTQAQTTLSSGVPFISDTQLQTALDQAGVPDDVANTVMADYSTARLEALQVAMGLVALFALIALFFTRLIPTMPVGSSPPPAEADAAPAEASP
jgi:EmrB/QacA subfamily drug resistance transporter